MEDFNSSSERLCVCLFAFKSEDRQEYKKSLSDFHVRVIDIENDNYCQVFLESVKFNGMLIDIPTYIKSSQQTKSLISSLSAIYPSAKIRHNKENSRMDLIFSGETNIITLSEFLERCRMFAARKIRKYDRIVINLNVRVFYEAEGKPSEVLCTSANISEDGLFVINRTGSLPMGASVKVQILELGAEGFLYGTVMRSLEWGEKRFQAPGFGIRIDGADKEIFTDYIELIKQKPAHA